MSTDIVALEKQYAKLRRKQHHACVVISGIKPVRAETDVDNDNPSSPGAQPVQEEESNHVESSVAMLTLSVPLEVEKSSQELTDPISPTVFGDTKCFFVQNLKKKTKDQHHQKHSKRSSKTDNTLHQGKPSSGENESTAYHEDSSKKPNKRSKKVCFKDEINNGNIKKTHDEASFEDNHDEEPTSDNDDCNGISENIKQRSETDKDDSKGVNKSSVRETCIKNGLKDNVHAETNDERESFYTDSGTIHHGITNDNHSKVEPTSHSPSCEVNEFVQNNTPEKSEEESQQIIDEVDTTEKSSELDTNIVKTSRTQGLRNPSLKFSKQYYPSNQASHKKHRTKSESVENTNKQSIYQHFNLTKRQLSLDSALSGGNNKSTQAKGIEFPFPVHTINEHKIKAGMRLGLYDHTALEKLEKTRKIPKTKLPNLTFD